MKKSLREIDALIATEIMGWRLLLRSSGEQVGVRCPPYWFPVSPPKYSSDISAAWEVVERLKEETGIFYCIEQHHLAEEPTAWLFSSDDVPAGTIVAEDAAKWSATAATVPLAISLAALKTKGIEIEVEETPTNKGSSI